MELLLRFKFMVQERRRHLRHKTHSPAYASMGAGVGGVVLDANESGAAVESVARLAPQSFLDLRLDLLDMHSSAVTPARVAWCDDGRVGLEFLNLTGESRRQLQQWLLMNALLATESASQLPQKQQAGSRASAESGQEAAADPGLMSVAERALAATGADGAAIALAEGAEIVCRATAGEIAPPPGTKLQGQSGISGACVSSGRWLRCDDPSVDPNVDRESCRALGINSVVAVPIGEPGNVLGLIEVFSRQTYAFQEEHCAALQAMAESVALSLQPKKAEPTASAAEEPAGKVVASAQETPAAAQLVAAVTSVAATEPATAVVAPVSGTVAAAASESGSQPLLGSEFEQATPSAGGGKGIVMLGLAAALLIVGLWFVLSRNTSEIRQVDAAEPSGTQAVEQPAGAGEKLPPGASSGAEMSNSLRDLRGRAQAGEAEAQFELGAKYASGEEVAQDYAEAVKWFTRAAEGGQVLAAATLGAYYWAGRGVPQDDVSAYMWSSIARQEGDEASRYRIAILRARMTARQIMEGEQRAGRWRQAHFRSAASASATPK